MVEKFNIVKLALDLKAENCQLFDVSKHSSLTDYVLVCSADNERQVGAIAQNIIKNHPKSEILGVDGMESSRWVIIDMGQIIIHVFHEEERQIYHLEEIFQSSPKVKLPEDLFLSA